MQYFKIVGITSDNWTLESLWEIVSSFKILGYTGPQAIVKQYSLSVQLKSQQANTERCVVTEVLALSIEKTQL